MSLRILGGTARGRAFSVPDSARPSGVRLRKSLFDLLAVRHPDGRFVDLHGGSGAIALEAASRGYTVTVVERDPAAARTLTANAKALALRANIVQGDSGALLTRLGQHDLVFSDPPYTQDIPAFTARVLASGIVAPGGLLMAQHPIQTHLPETDGYDLERKVYGSNALSLYTRHDAPDPQNPEEDTPPPA
ncbi:RsmD family RNA methyltransferase [Deinococcus aquiradiocola]|uniref:N-6 DNA methylase n=1 Tax=Deinococcus aquiradiocola TaxID=393059 RepID=A0A917P6M9_9DEIO|nr:RsmD family RNA methyltransferase [Deinococcus aquiradiocola]GGJ64346.1 N-6 DNA methylase [Deinococcus aquiradiocola]